MRTLVLDGGGMRCAFTAGVLREFKERGINYKFFDNYVGTSVGSGIMTYFFADKFERGFRIWSKHIPNHFKGRLLGFRDGMHYLERLFREVEPLPLKTISSRKQRAFVPLTNINTMKTEYTCLNDAKDPISILLAAVAWPIYFPPQIINGNPYYDGGLTSAIPIEKAQQLNSDEIWVILTTPPDYHKKSFRYKLVSLLTIHRPKLRKLIAQRPRLYNSILKEISKRNDLVVIRPERTLPVHFKKTNTDALKATIEIGRQTADKILGSR